jgi:hypothetical protein
MGHRNIIKREGLEMRRISTLLLASVLFMLRFVLCVAAADDLSLATGLTASPRMMPLRIVQPLECLPGSEGCKPNLNYDKLRAVVDRTNSIYSAAGIKLWLKSVEYYYIPKMFKGNTEEYTWGDFKSHSGSENNILDIFSNMPADAYHDTLDKKDMANWLASATALYGDPDEVLVWVMHGSGSSSGQSPINGRTAFINAANCYHAGTTDQPNGWATSHFAHEVGHFFGPRHPWDGYLPLNPKTNSNFTLADEWDMLHCENPLHFYTSRDDFVNNPCAAPKRTYNYFSVLGDSFTAPCVEILGSTYCLGDTVVQGLLTSTGLPDNPPKTSSFAYNVMGYYSDAKLDTRVPAFFNETQKEWIDIYMNYDVAYQDEFRTAKLTYEEKLPKGTSETYLTSLRTKLGTSHEDFIWWSNGDLTFARQTVPIKGTGYRPVRGDFDGDGHDDIIWYNPSAGTGSIWWGNSNRTFTKTSLTNLPKGCIIFAGNFDGKHGDDFYLYKSGTNGDKIYWSKGDRTFSVQTKEVTGGYKPLAGDFDGDGVDDIFWYHPASGKINIWWSDGDRTFTSVVGVSTGLINYTPIVGNFDGQAGDDIFWYRPGTGSGNAEYVSWSVQGSRNFTKTAAQSVSGTYNAFAGDFQGDGIDDIFWDAQGHTTDRIWKGSTSRKFSSVNESVYGVFLPIAGDFDGDGKTDIFWYRGAN